MQSALIIPERFYAEMHKNLIRFMSCCGFTKPVMFAAMALMMMLTMMMIMMIEIIIIKAIM